MAQEGSPPRRSSRLPESGPPATGRHSQRDRADYDQDGYGPGQYDQAQHDQGQHGYGQDELGQHGYGQSPYGQTPYGQNQLGQDRYGQDPYGQNPYGGQDQPDQGSYGQGSHSQERNGEGQYPPAQPAPGQPPSRQHASRQRAPEQHAPGQRASGQHAQLQDDRPATPVRPPDSRQQPDRASRPGRSDRQSWLEQDPFTAADDGDLPPWAGPSIYPTGPGGIPLRPPAEPEADDPGQGDGAPPAGRQRRRGRGRAAAARLRKSRRRVYIWCGTAIALAVIIAGVAVIRGLTKPVRHSSFITTLQPGEFRSVPKACTSVGSALLGQYLPGPSRKVTPANASADASQCSFTVDSKPNFRVLQITVQAYQPSLVQAGNGSATANATDTFLLKQQQLAHPGKRSPLPAAQMTPLAGLGQRALSALQVLHVGHATTDLVTVLARDRNLLVTVSLQAQASGRGFGPVSVATVRAGALAVSHVIMAKATAGHA